jgi:hypothetical protein
MIRKIPSLDRGLKALKRSCGTRRLSLSIAVTLLLPLIVWNAIAGRRIWKPAEVPVAFWSWRFDTPSETDVNEAVRQTGTKSLFLRAGQIDYEAGKLSRIRPVTGPIPGNIAIHLVYNATRSFLKEFERISAAAAGRAVLDAFDDDLDRAHTNHAEVVGLQLDFDVPTRLLPNYAAILKSIRARLSNEVQLSITGLPTWLESPALLEPLSACDFWVPQCYGAQIPERLDQRIPITTPEHVAQAVSRTRDLGLPFYAGLAAYGYAIHYSREGLLIGLRGDLDPLLVVTSTDFELADQTPFFLNAKKTAEKKAGEWRCTYRARRDAMVDGTVIRGGESLLLDRPTAAGLRACARKVREQAGARLLGICVFRIPGKGDSTTLTLPEIASALSDVEPRFSLGARVDQLSVEEKGKHSVTAILKLENNGAAASRAGEGALTVLVRVPAGCLESVTVDQSASAETVFQSGDEAMRCAMKRANAVKLSVGSWPPGAKLTVRFETKGGSPNDISLRYAATLDDGSVMEGSQTLKVAGMR